MASLGSDEYVLQASLSGVGSNLTLGDPAVRIEDQAAVFNRVQVTVAYDVTAANPIQLFTAGDLRLGGLGGFDASMSGK